MNKSEARGYYFEQIVRNLMFKTNYIDVKTRKIAGRGADHQIDSVGFLLLLFHSRIRFGLLQRQSGLRMTIKLVWEA